MTAVVTGLFHIAVKTSNLELTRKFWCDIIGLTEMPRPDFGYPGAWLAVPLPGGLGILHVYAGGPALDNEGVAPTGTGAIDHVSLTAVGFRAFIERFRESGLPWREFLVPGTSLWQLFVYDPSGVQLELTFDAAVESGPVPEIPDDLLYRAGQSFFDASAYQNL